MTMVLAWYFLVALPVAGGCAVMMNPWWHARLDAWTARKGLYPDELLFGPPALAAVILTVIHLVPKGLFS